MSSTAYHKETGLMIQFGVPLPPNAWTPCREEPDAFFPDGGGRLLSARWAAQQCATRCPFRYECFTWAADPANQVRYGIWGGFRFDRRSPDRPFIDAYRAAVWPNKKGNQ